MTQQIDQKEYWNGKTGEDWTRWADQLDDLLAPMGDAALDRLGPRPGESIIDIGCGSGATSLGIREAVCVNGATGRVTGVDISAPQLAQARQRAEGLDNIRFAEADAGTDILPEAPFDGAFSRFGVMFFPDPPRAFSHIRRQLKPGGRLAFACWQPIAVNDWMLEPVKAILPLLPQAPEPPDPDQPGPFAFADPDKVRDILQASGWQGIGIEPFSAPLHLPGDTLDEVVRFQLQIGPMTRLLQDHEIDITLAAEALKAHMSGVAGADGQVSLTGAIWIVTARA